MNQKPPELKWHKVAKQFFVRYAGKMHYLGHDRKKANSTYLDHLKIWASWRERRNERRLPPLRSSLTIFQLGRKFLASRLREGGSERLDYYRKHLKRWFRAHGEDLADGIRPIWLQRIKDEMISQGFAARTVNHDLQAVKTMIQWGVDLELIPPCNLRGIKKLPTGEVPDRSLPIEVVRHIVFGHWDWSLTPWLAMQYLCAMRPSEVVRVVTGVGGWESEGVWKMPGKTTLRTKMPRRVLFSPEALSWLPHAEPYWSRLDSYSLAVRKAVGVGPHTLRHSAGTHLMLAGVSRHDADAILGHYPSEISLTYMPLQWQHLRESAARISLRTH